MIAASMTPDELSQRSKKAAATRWRGHVSAPLATSAKRRDLRTRMDRVSDLRTRMDYRATGLRVRVTAPKGQEFHRTERIVQAADIDEALSRIARGEVVEVKSVKEAGTLVERLGQIAQEAKAKGEKAPNYDLCQVSIPGTNLFCGQSKGVKRIDMPQLGGFPRPGSKADKLPRTKEGGVDAYKQFEQHLAKMGVRVTPKQVKASSLKASQRELIGTKIGAMMRNRDFDPAGEAIFVSRDGYVIDGHHRWAAQVGRDLEDGKLGDKMLNVKVVDLPISTVLREAVRWADEFGIESAAGKV